MTRLHSIDSCKKMRDIARGTYTEVDPSYETKKMEPPGHHLDGSSRWYHQSPVLSVRIWRKAPEPDPAATLGVDWRTKTVLNLVLVLA